MARMFHATIGKVKPKSVAGTEPSTVRPGGEQAMGEFQRVKKSVLPAPQ